MEQAESLGAAKAAVRPQVLQPWVLPLGATDPISYMILQSAGFIQNQRAAAEYGEVQIRRHTVRLRQAELLQIPRLHAHLLRIHGYRFVQQKAVGTRSEEHTPELQPPMHVVC